MKVTIHSAGFAPAARASHAVHALGKYAASFGLSLGVTSLFNATLVLLKETNETTLLAWMKAATGHHWITHGLIDLALFVVLGLALAGTTGEKLGARPGIVLAAIVGGMVLGALVIAGFYV